MNLILIAIGFILFFVAAFPLKNYFELKMHEKKQRLWTIWLKEGPSLKEYCERHNQPIETPVCDYCGSSRQFPSIEMVIVNNPTFGFISNHFKNYSYFKSYICGGCGSELYRGSEVS